MEAVASGIFEKMDTDHNGLVTMSEFAHGQGLIQSDNI
jgi:hypothetical protein